MLKRGWKQTETVGWNLQWCEKDKTNDIFQEGLGPQQKLNHFRLYTQVLCFPFSFAEKIVSSRMSENIKK